MLVSILNYTSEPGKNEPRDNSHMVRSISVTVVFFFFFF